MATHFEKVQNVTVAKFELMFTRCLNNLKIVRNLKVETYCKTLMPKKCTYILRIDGFVPKTFKMLLSRHFECLYVVVPNVLVRVPF